MHCTVRHLVTVALFFIAISAYPTWACGDFYAKLPNVSQRLCQDAKLLPSGARSVNGRPILVRDVSAGVPRLRVLVVAAMHGDELSSASVALHWLKQAQLDPAAFHWRFIPLLNPDGLLRDKPWRMNAHGVDLNRNFPTPDWRRQTRLYWEKRTGKDPRRWPGHTPLSEPEARYLFNEMARFKPQVVVSIHAPYGVLDFDGPQMPPTRLGRLYLHQVGVFPGSLGNFSGVQRGIPVVTVELPSALRTPTDADMQTMWQDLRAWIERTLPPEKSPAPRIVHRVPAPDGLVPD